MLLKEPTPVPSLVLLLLVVGEPVVFQHTPRAVTELPPSDVTFPPLVALADVIPLAAVVVSIGAVANVAVIFLSAFIVTVSGLLLLVTLPVQPTNDAEPVAVAVRLILLPGAKSAEFILDAVLIPAGLLVTLPVPEVAMVSLRGVTPPVMVALQSIVAP